MLAPLSLALFLAQFPVDRAPAVPASPTQANPTAPVADRTWTAGTSGAQATDGERGWDLSVSERGVLVRPTMVPGTAAPETWTFEIGTASFGRMGAAEAIDPGAPSVSGGRVTLQHGPLSEWFERGEHGVEHGWTIPSDPGGDPSKPLWIGLRVGGDLSMHIADDGGGAFLRDARGVLRLRYGYLKTYDATGAVIPSRMSTSPWGVGIQIDAREALFPIMVDPVVVPPAWQREFDQAGQENPSILFQRLNAAGDVNGDGFSDVIIGLPLWDGGAGPDEGQVWVFHGSSSGLSLAPDWIASGTIPGSLHFGAEAVGIGDVNGDSYGDIAIGATGHGPGTLYVYYGGPGGLGQSGTPANADFTYQGPPGATRFGERIIAIGNVDGDGHVDFAVASRFETVGGAVNAGRIYIFFGSSSGIVLGPTNPWSATPLIQANIYPGYTMSGGDVNADGYSDVLINASGYGAAGFGNSGRAFVYHGGPGFRTDTTWDLVIEPPTLQTDQYFGTGRIIGDFNGDGFADAVISADSHDAGQSDEGKCWLYYGGPGGLAPTPSAAVEGNEALVYLGQGPAACGDIDGDGFADVFVSVSGRSSSTGPRLFYGGPSGSTFISDRDQYLPNDQPTTSSNGYGVAGVGDVNNDGFMDIGHLAITYANGQTDEGKAYVHFGSPNPLTSPQPGGVQQPLMTAGTIQNGTSGSQMGRAVSSAGDVNADGFNDIIVGSPEFGATNNGRVQVFLGSANGLNLASPFWTLDSPNTGERFGWSVSAGDIDNDGRSDIVVGAPNYANGQTNEGRVYLFRSTPTGIAASPTWSFESNEAGALLGSSVSALGDVNADGHTDIAAGAPGALGGQGSVTLFHGRATSLASITAVITVTSGVPGSQFGSTVALVGDVDLDGYGDLAVGAPSIDNPQVDEGRVYVYLGSYQGITNAIGGQDESQQAGAMLGSSVASCGDINGDGRAEILVGAPGYNAATSGGGAFVYQSIPAGSGVTLSVLTLRTGEQANSQYGYAVSAGGDVNGDGWNDVLVGAPDYDGAFSNQGRVYLYLGSSSGLAASPSETYDGPSANTRFGESIALGGDVNGDGLSDPIGGVPSANGGDGGTIPLVGGGTTSCRYTTAQRQYLDFQALQILGRSDGTGGFGMDMGLQNGAGNTATALGRIPVRLQYEVQQVGTLLDGSAALTQTSWVDSGALGTGFRLSQTVLGLQPDRSYHWRVRTLLRSPYMPHTRWTTIQLDGLQEKKLGLATDCNNNGTGDSTDISIGNSLDCDFDNVPDECQVPPLGNQYSDCNANLVPDFCELLFNDCDGDFVPDDCQLPPLGDEDCDGNYVVDECDVLQYGAPDTNGDLVPDSCQELLMNVTLFCPGDGASPHTNCPCSNNSPAGNNEGCLSSLGIGGRLRASGIARVLAPYDNFVLLGTQMPNSSALYFQGTTQQGSGNGSVFGDGLRCTAGSVLRLGTKINTGGGSQYPSGGDLPISVKGALGPGGGTRYYQCWYRNAAAFCSAATFNLSNGLRVLWIP